MLRYLIGGLLGLVAGILIMNLVVSSDESTLPASLVRRALGTAQEYDGIIDQYHYVLGRCLEAGEECTRRLVTMCREGSLTDMDSAWGHDLPPRILGSRVADSTAERPLGR